MRFTFLLDHDFRYVYCSGVSSDWSITKQQLLGTRPWDWLPEIEQPQLEDRYRRIAETKGRVSFGVEFQEPGTDFRRYYWTVLEWVGGADVAIICRIWEFPYELTSLTPREREVIELIGDNHVLKSVAAGLGISVNTIYAHLKSIREKLDLDAVEEVQHFASNYLESRSA